MAGIIDLCSSDEEAPPSRPFPQPQHRRRPSHSKHTIDSQTTPRAPNQGGAIASGSGRNGGPGAAGGDGAGTATPRAGAGAAQATRAVGATAVDEGKEKNCIVLGDTDSEAEEDDEATPPRAPTEVVTIDDYSEEDLPPASALYTRRSPPRRELPPAQSAAAGPVSRPSTSEAKPTSSTSNAKATSSQLKSAPTIAEIRKDPPPLATLQASTQAADAPSPPHRHSNQPEEHPKQQKERNGVAPAAPPPETQPKATVGPNHSSRLPSQAVAQRETSSPNAASLTQQRDANEGEGGPEGVSQAAERAFTGAQRLAKEGSAPGLARYERSAGSASNAAVGQKQRQQPHADVSASAIGLDLCLGAAPTLTPRPQPQSMTAIETSSAIRPLHPAVAGPTRSSGLASRPSRPQLPSQAVVLSRLPPAILQRPKPPVNDAVIPSRPPPAVNGLIGASRLLAHKAAGSSTSTGGPLPRRQEVPPATTRSSGGNLGGLVYDFAERASISTSGPQPSPDSRPTQQPAVPSRLPSLLPGKPPSSLPAKTSPIPRPDPSRTDSPLPHPAPTLPQPQVPRTLYPATRTSTSSMPMRTTKPPPKPPQSESPSSTLEEDLLDLSLGPQAPPTNAPTSRPTHYPSLRNSLNAAPENLPAQASSTASEARPSSSTVGLPLAALAQRADGHPVVPVVKRVAVRRSSNRPLQWSGNRVVGEGSGRSGCERGGTVGGTGSERGGTGEGTGSESGMPKETGGMAQKEDEASEDERRYTAAAKGKGKAMEVDDEDEPTTTAASLQLQALTSRLTRVAQLGGRIGSQLSKRSAESPAVVEPSKRAKQDRESNGTVKVMATLSGVIVPAKDGGEASFERHLAIEYEAEEATMDSTTEDLQLSVSAEHPVDVRRGVPRADVVPVFVEQGGSELGEEVLQLEANVVAGTLTDPAADARRQKEINEYLEEQKRTPSHFRNIAGPSFDGEFDSDLQDDVELKNKKHLAQYKHLHKDDRPDLDTAYQTVLFEEWVFEMNSKEIRHTQNPRIRVIPPADGDQPHSPPFEFYWTNRVVYPRHLLPEQSPGCDCEGDCQDAENVDSCACLKRQTEACATREDGIYDRSGHQGFAYNEGGQIAPEIDHEPVWECNSECGCGDGCINRVVGLKKGVDVDIFHSGVCGWGVRNPKDAGTILAGTPLGIYGAELLESEEADARVGALYDDCGRNYLFDIGYWSIEEDHLIAMKARAANSTASNPKKAKAKKGKRSKKKQAIAEDVEEFTIPYSGDAFFYGNWTRFVNHRCTGANAGVRPVHIDEGNAFRPLHVFVATKDIAPGEQIFINYFSNRDACLKVGQSLDQYQEIADDRRCEAEEGKKCMCGVPLCRGIMFQDADIIPEGDDDDG